MKNDKSGNWPSGFNFESLEQETKVEFSDEIIEASYEALNRFYQKESKRSKDTPKRKKQAWQ